MEKRGLKIRLHLDAALSIGGAVPLERDQANYLFNVMRRKVGDTLLIFNGRDGEFRAMIEEAGKRAGVLRVVGRTRSKQPLPDIHLLFAPIKKARTDFIVEKACELGCAAVQPVFTRFTNSERLNHDRLKAHMIEAAEQCGGVAVPELLEAAKLDVVLRTWENERALIFCDEAGEAPLIREALAEIPRGAPVAVLIGPEGGFDEEERESLRNMEATCAVSLGPRILRADTAAVAALTMVQAAIGDWI